MKAWLNSKLKGGTSGVVMKAMGLFGGMQMLVILCGVVRVKIVALLLGATGVGLFSIFNNALTLLSTATQLGLRSSAVREVAAGDDAGAARSAAMVRFWGRVLGLFGLVVTLVAAPWLSVYTFGDYSHTLGFMMIGVAVALMALTVAEQAVMQGRKRLGALARSTMAGVIGGLVVSVPLVYFLRINSIVPVVVAYAVTAWIGVKIYRCGDAEPACRARAKELWREGLPMLRLGGYMTVAAVVTEAVNYVFIIYLTHAGGTDAVGVYQSGYTVMMRYVGMVFTALGVEYYPRLASCNANPARQQVFIRHETMLLMAVLGPLLAVFMPLAPLVVKILYTTEFLDAVPYIIASAPGVVLRGYAWCLSFLMLARGDGRTYVITEIASALIGLALNVAGYRYGGMLGLGLSFTLWYAVYAVMMVAVNVRLYGGRMSRRVTLTSLSVLAAVIAIALILIFFKPNLI